MITVLTLGALCLIAARVEGTLVLERSDLGEELVNELKKIDLGSLKEGEITAVINEYADKVLHNLDQVIVHAGFDPTELPDIHDKISFKPLFITYWGEFNMTKGWLQDVSSIHRDGDVVISYKTDISELKISVPLTFNDLQLYYNYAVKIMGLGPTGGVTGKVTDFRMKIVIKIDLENYVFSVEDYDIIHSGHISVHFNGNVLIDWLVNLMTNTATMALKPIILAVIEMIVKGTMEGVFNIINEAIYNFLHPTSPTPIATSTVAYDVVQRLIGS